MNIKEEIIKIVTDMENQIGTEKMGDLFQKESISSKDTKIGSNQFRDIASMCAKAESYAEIELMIKYNIAKANIEKSWKLICSNNKIFGDIILDSMNKVTKIDETKILENMELFFGYLYWQARIWADRYSNDSNKNKNHNNRMPDKQNRHANRS